VKKVKQVRRDRKALRASVARPDRLGQQGSPACRVKGVKQEFPDHKVRQVREAKSGQ